MVSYVVTLLLSHEGTMESQGRFTWGVKCDLHFIKLFPWGMLSDKGALEGARVKALAQGPLARRHWRKGARKALETLSVKLPSRFPLSGALPGRRGAQLRSPVRPDLERGQPGFRPRGWIRKGGEIVHFPVDVEGIRLPSGPQTEGALLGRSK